MMIGPYDEGSWPQRQAKSRPKRSLDRQTGRSEEQTGMDVVSWSKSREVWRRQNEGVMGHGKADRRRLGDGWWEMAQAGS